MVDLNLTIPAKSVYEPHPKLEYLTNLISESKSYTMDLEEERKKTTAAQDNKRIVDLETNIGKNKTEIDTVSKDIETRGSVILTKYIASYDLQFSLPILTIIPLNALAVLSVDINFEMEVKSSFEETVKEKSESKAAGEIGIEATAGYAFAKVSIKGSASYSSSESKERDTHYSKSNNAKYTVNVKAGQLPTPEGIKTILDIYTKNILPIGEEPSSKPAKAQS